MADIEVVANIVRRPVDQIRRPMELLEQGLDPVFLATYRPDEIGQLDRRTLAKIKRAIDYLNRVEKHRESVRQQLEADHQWNDSLEGLLKETDSIALIDRLTRSLRSRKGSRAMAEKQPEIAKLGHALLTLEGQTPANLEAWTAEFLHCSEEQAGQWLGQTRRWLQLLLSEDPQLLLNLGRLIYRKAMVTISLLELKDEPEGAGDEDATSLESASVGEQGGAMAMDASGASGEDPAEDSRASADMSSDESSAGSAMVGFDEELAQGDESSPSDESADTEAEHASDADTHAADEFAGDAVAQSADELARSDASSADTNSAAAPSDDPSAQGSSTEIASNDSTGAESLPTEEGTVPVAIEGFQRKGKKQRPQARTLKSDARLSPRQRRRKWLRSVLETYVKLRKPLTKLTPYQVLMLGRGHRSQLIKLNIDYDLKPLIQVARDSFGPGHHPLHRWLLDVAEEGLKKVILPKLEQDLLAEMEEAAHQELTEIAVDHLEDSLMQRPVRGHRILMIDAIGPKTAAIAIVDAAGEVLHTDELLCNTSRPDVVTQNVTLLGTLAHRFHVTLLAISNGPSRRYLIHTVNDFMKQSTEGSIYWTMIDRAGADAYCASRVCLRELPNISKRHRAAVWLARRLQDPLKEILKVDPARLRLGSFQRELPQDALSKTLESAVFSCMASQGIDAWYASERILEHVPGIDRNVARALTNYRKENGLSSREQLRKDLEQKWSDADSRMALGFLRIYGGDQPLDATAIHPDDYRLAQRLIDNSQFGLPPSSPPGWSKPKKEVAAPTTAAGSETSATDTSATETGAGEVGAGEANPDAMSIGDATQETIATTNSDAAAGQTAEAAGAPLASATGASASTEAAPEASAANSQASSDPQAVSESGASSEATSSDTTGELSADSGAGAEGVQEGGAVNASRDPAAVDANAAAASPASEPTSTSGSSPSTTSGSISIIEPVKSRPKLELDVEKLAKSWQVGREKLRQVAYGLLDPFGDARDELYPIPLMTRVPTLENLTPGTAIWAAIIGVAPFGAFADLGPDCSGLIHVSRLSATYVEDPHQVVQVGDLVRVWVVEIDGKRRRVALTMIPPGTEVQRESHPHRTDDREQHPRGQRPRRTDRRTDQPEGKAPRGEREQARGGQRPHAPRGRAGGGRRDDQRGDQRPRGKGFHHEGQRPKREWQSTKVNPPRPVTPISENMEKGIEPLRSFSDLMQFYQKKRDEPPASPPTPPPPAPDNTESA